MKQKKKVLSLNLHSAKRLAMIPSVPMRNLFLALTISLFLIVPISRADSKVKTPLSSSDLSEFQSCKESSNCIIVQNGCCDCANGGEDVAINKTMRSNFLERFNCSETACTELAAIPSCGSGTVHCIKGKCQYKNPPGEG